MKKKIAILGLVGCLTLGNVSIAVGDMAIDGNAKDKLLNPENPKKISIELKEKTIRVESEVIKSDMDNAEISIEIPVIKGLKDANYEEQLNNLIKLAVEKDLEEFKKQAKEISELDVEWKPQKKVGYEVKAEAEGDILSFVIDTYTYTGGANGISRKDYYNIDVKGNKTINLDDLFKEASDYKTIINDEINKQIEEQVATGEKVYFEDEEGFKTIDEAQTFFIDKDGNLVITFQMYEIAPRYIGHPEFEIPKSSIAHILKDGQGGKIENKETINFNNMIINDKELKLQEPMFKSEKGTVMIPLREVAEALDFTVTWDQKNKVANINRGPIWAGAYIGKDKYYFSKALVFLEEEAQLIKGTTFVPVSFIDEVIKGEKTINDDGVLNIKY